MTTTHQVLGPLIQGEKTDSSCFEGAHRVKQSSQHRFHARIIQVTKKTNKNEPKPRLRPGDSDRSAVESGWSQYFQKKFLSWFMYSELEDYCINGWKRTVNKQIQGKFSKWSPLSWIVSLASYSESLKTPRLGDWAHVCILSPARFCDQPVFRNWNWLASCQFNHPL